MRTGFVELATISAALLTLTACSNTVDPDAPAPVVGQPTETTSAQGEPVSAAPNDEGTRIEVIETEYSITLPRTLAPGRYTFVVDNMGRAGHDLAIKGPGVDVVKRLPHGGRAEIITTLQPGTYELWCPMDDHRDRGMLQTVAVTA